ncbi:hypothetical protein Sya03_49960 [Spirilliplanes yamanashiensis]|uniref:RelA/SpoT domain-containing protein n=1 Tax=Spirilliplanes yamanashiensis TaxID=42233 RepID=A0A8J3YCM1_9ACTN|nr:hypothetical protein Sya03_49960 [Spirilliplanes yamanashiensis]
MLPSPVPHPLDCLWFDVPGWARGLFEFALGVDWPDGDETTVWDLADQWHTVADALAAPQSDAARAAHETWAALGGDTDLAAAFGDAWHGLTDGPDAPLPALIAATRELATVVEGCGTDIEAAKLEVWIEVGIFAAELAALAAAALCTAGAAAGAAGPIVAATRFAITRIFRRLLAKLSAASLRGPARLALSAAEEGAAEAATQLAVQHHQLTHSRRDDLDWLAVRDAAAGGLAGGAAAPLASLGRHGRGNTFLENVAREMGGEVLASNAASLAVSGELSDLGEMGSSAVSGTRSSVTTQATDALGGRLEALPPAALPAEPGVPRGVTGASPTSAVSVSDPRPSGARGSAGVAVESVAVAGRFASSERDASLPTSAPGAVTSLSPPAPGAVTSPASPGVSTPLAPSGGQPSSPGALPVSSPASLSGPSSAAAPVAAGAMPPGAPAPAGPPAVAPSPPPPGASPLPPAAPPSGALPSTPATHPAVAPAPAPATAVHSGPSSPGAPAGGPPRPPSPGSDLPADDDGPAPPPHAVVPYLGLPVAVPDPAEAADTRRRRAHAGWARLLRTGATAAHDADRQAQAWSAAAAVSRDWAVHHEARGEPEAAQRWWSRHRAEQANADHWHAERDALLAGDGGRGAHPDDEGPVPTPTGPDDPPSAASRRPYGLAGGLREPLAVHQRDLEAALPRDTAGRPLRTPDPREGTWLRLANDGGPGADPTRAVNCQDCVLSFYDTWLHGRPHVAAPRTFDGYLAADVSRPPGGERNGPRRAEQVTGGRYQTVLADVTALPADVAARQTADAFAALDAQLRTAGPGSMALIINGWPDGSAHAWTAVNQDGTVLWVDPQRGVVSDTGPLYTGVSRFDALMLGPDGIPAPLPERPPGAWSALPPLDAPPTPPTDRTPLSVLDTSPAGAAPGGAPDVRARRLAAQAALDASDGSIPAVIAGAPDLEAAFAAGVRPADLAAHLDAATVARLWPGLSSADAARAAALFADPTARSALERAWADPANGEPLLAERLVRDLPRRPGLLAVIERSPELHDSLLARPLTLLHVAEHPEAVAALAEIVAEADVAEVADNPNPPPAPLTDRQAAISAAAAVPVPTTGQEGFDLARRRDDTYVAAYLDDLYAAARVAQQELNGWAQSLADRFPGARAGWRTAEKDRRRALDKVADYDGDVARLTDLAGAKVEFGTVADLYEALAVLTGTPGITLVRFEDRFLGPMRSGYRDVQMLVRLSNGHIGEFRLHLAAIDEVAAWEHALFEVRRDLKALAAAGGRRLTTTERSLVNGILRLEQHSFHEALMSSMGEGRGRA